MNAPNSLLIAFLYTAWLSTINDNHTLPEQLSSHASSSTTLTGSTKTTMTTDEILFQQVPLDTNEQTACSPADPGIDWRGVEIRAPSRVFLPEKTLESTTLIIPVCGLYLVDVTNKFRYPGPKIVVISDDKSGKTYKGELIKRIPDRTIPPPPSPPVKPSKNAAFGSYFNVNVAAYVTLPMQSARYRVKIEYAGYQSNEVIIEVFERP